MWQNGSTLAWIYDHDDGLKGLQTQMKPFSTSRFEFKKEILKVSNTKVLLNMWTRSKQPHIWMN